METADLSGKTLHFVHIPKSAGNTANSVFIRQFHKKEILELEKVWLLRQSSLDKYCELPDKDKKQIAYMGGHFPFGLHYIAARPSVYVTFLRDPVDRTISNYYYVKSMGFDALKQKAENIVNPSTGIIELLNFLRLSEHKRDSLEDYVDLCIDFERMNLQTRMIGGFIDFRHLAPPYDPMPADALQISLENIQLLFPVVGLLERFDESLLLMGYAFGWKNVYYVRQNITESRPAVKDIPVVTRNRIANLCGLDYELYEIARKRMDDQMAELGDLYQNELLRFKENLKWYGRMSHIYRRSGLYKLRHFWKNIF